MSEDAGDWKIFRMSDFDWFVARSLDEAKQALATHYSCSGVAEAELHHMIARPRELTFGELDNLRFHDSNENEQLIGRGRSFRNELKRRIAEGLSAPEMFATTEI